MNECPNCRSRKHLSWESNFTFEECGYEGTGIVTFIECLNCGAKIEICVPDENPYADDKKKKGGIKNE